MNRKYLWQIPLLLFLIVGTIYIARQQRSMPWQYNEGKIFGTFYHITYQCDHDLQDELVAELKKVDCALSMFNDSSVISRINRGEVFIDPTSEGKMFLDVFHLAMKISDETSGAFDITVAPLVNAWGFGFKNEQMPTETQVDSLRQLVGYQHIRYFKEHGKEGISKPDPRIMLDCSAIAKGYGVDRVAHLLHRHDVQNFMVEIGGEIVVDGKNKSSEPWRIGITKPSDDPESQNGELQAVLAMPLNTQQHATSALATSGNYRNFYYKDGRRYAHTIDPRTGYPVQHRLLSATVVAPTCAEADAYATAFMVLGLDSARQILSSHPELKAYLISTGTNNDYTIWQSPGLTIE